MKTKAQYYVTIIVLLFFRQVTCFAQCKHVILVSIDGMHPDIYTDNGWPVQNIQSLAQKGTYADRMISVFPAYTYPSHTAMLTGALPARSKVVFNQPVGDKSGNWNWFASAIKVPTIWQALHQHGLKTAAVMWPGTVGADIDFNLSEIWDNNHPDDRATIVRKYSTPAGIYEEIEKNATGKLDSTNMNDNYYSLDENAGRMAAYIFKKYKPNFLALHFATVDGFEHEFGRDDDSVRLAVEADDRAIGDVLEAVEQSGLKNSTAVIVVGDHGFSNIRQLFRPNKLILDVPARFVAAGGSCFLYALAGHSAVNKDDIIRQVTANLNQLPAEKRKLFRIINRKELDQMGADSSAILALTAVPGLAFSSGIGSSSSVNKGPGTLIQQSNLNDLFVPAKGGHHGYDPKEPDMFTGFIAAGAGIKGGGHIKEMRVVDVAPLIAQLLNIDFQTPDGHLVDGILKN